MKTLQFTVNGIYEDIAIYCRHKRFLYTVDTRHCYLYHRWHSWRHCYLLYTYEDIVIFCRYKTLLYAAVDTRLLSTVDKYIAINSRYKTLLSTVDTRHWYLLLIQDIVICTTDDTSEDIAIYCRWHLKTLQSTEEGLTKTSLSTVDGTSKDTAIYCRYKTLMYVTKMTLLNTLLSTIDTLLKTLLSTINTFGDIAIYCRCTYEDIHF